MIRIKVENGDKRIDYEFTEMQLPDKLIALQTILEVLDVHPDLNDLLASFYQNLERYERFFGQEAGGTSAQLRIEPLLEEDIPIVVRRPIFLNAISNEDTGWTGIHFSENPRRPRYQTFYRCLHCGNQENRFVFNSTKTIPCKNCHEKIAIAPATSAGKPKGGTNQQIYRDEFGNYFKNKEGQ